MYFVTPFVTEIAPAPESVSVDMIVAPANVVCDKVPTDIAAPPPIRMATVEPFRLKGAKAPKAEFTPETVAPLITEE